METICDQRMIQTLGQHNRQSYISTVLQYASNMPANQLQAAMHLNDGRSNMEIRIRNMYKDTRTGAGGRIIAVFLTAMLLAISVLTACQPTPETPPVVNKADNNLEKMIESSAQSSSPSAPDPAQPSAGSDAIKKAVEAPDTFKDTFTNKKGDVTVTIDAKMEVPAVETIPAISVKPCGFTQEQVDKSAAYFLKGAPVFTDVRGKLTKAKITEEIVAAQARIADAKKKKESETDNNHIRSFEE